MTKADLARFERRLKKLMDDFRTADDADGEPYAFVAGLYRRPDA